MFGLEMTLAKTPPDNNSYTEDDCYPNGDAGDAIVDSSGPAQRYATLGLSFPDDTLSLVQGGFAENLLAWRFARAVLAEPSQYRFYFARNLARGTRYGELLKRGTR